MAGSISGGGSACGIHISEKKLQGEQSAASVPGPVLHLFRGLRTMQGPGDFQRTVFEVNEWVMPAGTSQEFTIIAIGAEASAGGLYRKQQER